MNIVESAGFKKARKKLKPNQQKDLQLAVRDIANNVRIGQQKSGDLSSIRVHKFKMVKQLTLIAYNYQDDILTLTLIALGSHENFYRDLRRS